MVEVVGEALPSGSLLVTPRAGVASRTILFSSKI
uniref:Uncharacterized protein n=1 Tax=Physcomitrium patens TaxID=3218 RepID=A0A2K1KQE6_PHYPA|nr:hypothetical protein PHYPA_006885 [Physcomitrium patens]